MIGGISREQEVIAEQPFCGFVVGANHTSSGTSRSSARHAFPCGNPTRRRDRSRACDGVNPVAAIARIAIAWIGEVNRSVDEVRLKGHDRLLHAAWKGSSIVEADIFTAHGRCDRVAAARRFGHASFRPSQQDLVRAVLDGRDVLAVMPTGSGKSLGFQLPAVLLGGTTIVVSPLIARMKEGPSVNQGPENPG